MSQLGVEEQTFKKKKKKKIISDHVFSKGFFLSIV